MHFRHPQSHALRCTLSTSAPSDVLPHIRTRIADGQEHAFHSLPDTKGTDTLCQLRFCRSALMVPEVLMCHWTRLLSDQSLALIAFEKLFSFCWLHYTTEISCVTHDMCIFVYFYQGCRGQHVDSIQNSENFNWDGFFKKMSAWWRDLGIRWISRSACIFFKKKLRWRYARNGVWCVPEETLGMTENKNMKTRKNTWKILKKVLRLNYCYCILKKLV